jgi:hypothetical protein
VPIANKLLLLLLLLMALPSIVYFKLW